MQRSRKPHNTYRNVVVSEMQRMLYKTAWDKTTQELDALIAENNSICGNDCPAFTYKGAHYFLGRKTVRLNKPANVIRPQLRPAMETWLIECDQLQREMDIVLGYVKRVLADLPAAHQLKQFFPESMSRIDYSYLYLSGDDSPQERTWSQQEIDDFLTQNSMYLDMMKIRLVDNTIIGG